MTIFEPYDNIFELFRDLFTDDININDIHEFVEYLNNHSDDIQFFNDYINIINELKEYNIISYDFLNLTNIGYKLNTKTLVYFDIGFGKSNIQKIHKLNFYFKKETELFELLEIDKYKYLGSGGNGSAYDIGHDTVLKLTIDDSEGNNSHKLMGKKLKNIVYIHYVYKYKLMDLEEKYCIILDMLDTSETTKKDLKNRYVNLNSMFINFRNEL